MEEIAGRKQLFQLGCGAFSRHTLRLPELPRQFSGQDPHFFAPKLHQAARRKAMVEDRMADRLLLA
ncbi:MAG: hypothetical protein MUE52_07320 [Tabrizicola sp.]|jgi:hypothetical protein|nr:hypothetical protein [Tabrizicola sp.]